MLFLVIFVKDLTGVQEGNEDWIDEENGIINLDKLIIIGTFFFLVNTGGRLKKEKGQKTE
jgi:hypothetical protein